MRKLVLIAALAAAASASAWIWFARSPAGALDAGHPLHFIPADSPLVFASLEPLPEAVAQRWMDYTNAQFEGSRTQFEDIMRELETEIGRIAADIDPEPADATADAEAEAEDAVSSFDPRPGDRMILGWMKALQAEFEEAPDAQTLYQRLGLSTNTLYALYMVDSVPVLRIQLQDPATFIGAVERMQKNSGETLPTLQLDGIQAGWDFHFEEAPISLIVAVVDNYLVFAPAPKTYPAPDQKHSYHPATLRPLLGLERPAKSLADSGRLQAMIREQGYQSYAGGYLETAYIFQQLRQPATPLQQAFLAAIDVPKPELPPECDADIARFTTLFPRLTFGSSVLDKNQMNVIARLSTAPVIANELMQLRAPMPGRQVEDTSLAMYGMALKLQPLPGLGSRLANAALEQPWTCPALSGLNEISEQARNLNNAGVYAAAPIVQSYVLALEDLSLDIEASRLSALEAQLIIGSENPQSLIGSARMLDPDLAEFAAQLKPGAGAQTLPKGSELLTSFGLDQPLMVAVQEQALGIATGTHASTRLETLLAPAQPGPLLYFSYSGKVYTRLVEILREYAAQQPEPDPSMEAMIRNLDNGLDLIIDRLTVSLDITEKGVEFEYRIKFK